VSAPSLPAAAPLGLSAAEVRALTERGLVNTVRRETSRTYGGIVVSNLFNVFNVAVFSMAGGLIGLYFYARDVRTLYDSVTISTVALLNTLFGIVQEIRAKRALDRIRALARPMVRVIRDGRTQEIPSEEVVQGDVIEIRRGDQIPVDGKVLVSHHAEVDESLLTGESAYVYKEEGDPVLSGSFCVAGQSVIAAEKVGEESYIHRLTREARSYKRFLTPLQREIDFIIKVLMGVALTFAVLEIASAWMKFRLGQEAESKVEVLTDTLRAVTSMVTSMIPAGLVLLTTVAFALGVYRISRRGALVQKLNAIESFTNIQVLCMDKTGTLTKNELRVEQVRPLGATSESELEALLGAFAHGSTDKNATLVAIESRFPRPALSVSDEIPFNSKAKLSALSVEVAGKAWSLVLGAPDVLMPSFEDADAAAVRRAVEEHEGLRNLVFASIPHETGSLREALAAKPRMRALAAVALTDELRPDIGQVLEGFFQAGISLKVMSGDAPETVQAVARAAGWKERADRVVAGPELDRMSPDELDAAARSASLFARVSPKNKQDLVASLQRQGRYVAMVGDGVNDVLALKKAQIGVAMGAGSQMSKDVSDIVLLNNDFSILPAVFSEGKNILTNIQSAAKLFLTKNFYAVLLVLFAGYVGLEFPFVPRHVTVIGFFAVSVPAVLITISRADGEIPKNFLADVLRFSAISGGIIAFAALLSYFIVVAGLASSAETGRTVVLTQTVFLSLLNLLLVVGRGSVMRVLRGNLAMTVFAFAFGGLYVGMLLLVTNREGFQFLADFFEVEPLQWTEWSLSFVVTVFSAAGMILAQRRFATPPPSRLR
jgi:cation-transporting ATPase E